jgi:hypothetical protein
MKIVFAGGRVFLHLFLVSSLIFPAGLWAAAGRRDLVIEEFKERDINLWVLSVGVSQYANESLNLQYADNDAEKVAGLLASQKGVLFDEVNTHVLVNDKATRENILVAMSDFLGQAAGDDVVVIFLAGHGLSDRKTGTYYFVPHNADDTNLIHAGLPMQMFNEAIKRLQTHVNKVILLNDTCHAGGMQMGARGVSAGEDLTESLIKANGQYVLSASQAGEISLEREDFRFEGDDKGHGAFTYALLDGLRGKAADKEGVVWVSDLFGHVSKKVPRLTTGQQHPHHQMRGTDMPLFVLSDGTADTEAGANAAPVDIAANTPSLAAGGAKTGSKTWLWLLLGAAAAGGAGVAGWWCGGGLGRRRWGRQ